MNLRALVVEDDPSLREVATFILEGTGFEVTTASDGRVALDAFRSDQFDLVLLDLMLPIDQRVRGVQRDPPYLTGSDRDADGAVGNV